MISNYEMRNKTVLVTGATGFLGRQVVKLFEKKGWTVKGIGFSRADGSSIRKVDLGSAAEAAQTLDNTKADVVVHCAANRFPDKVDQDPEGTRKLNVTASRKLAELCSARSVFLIYISTDYVFSGHPGEAPYEADAKTGPTNLYGQTKLDGERAVQEVSAAVSKEKEGPGAVVLRVPVLYGPCDNRSESAVNVLMDVVVSKSQRPETKPIKMDHWALRYPTNTEDVARVCHDVAVRFLEVANVKEKTEELPRVLQFSSEDRYTKYEMCQLFADIMNLTIDRIEANTEGNDPNASVQRPYDCHLSTRALKDLGIDISTQNFEDWWRRDVKALRS